MPAIVVPAVDEMRSENIEPDNDCICVNVTCFVQISSDHLIAFLMKSFINDAICLSQKAII